VGLEHPLIIRNRRLKVRRVSVTAKQGPLPEDRKVAEGKDQMFSFKRDRSWVVPGVMLACLLLMGGTASAGSGSGKGKGKGNAKLDPALTELADSSGKGNAYGKSRVIVIVNPDADLTKDLRGLGAALLRKLPLIDGIVAELPNGQLRKLAKYPDVFSVHLDRPTGAHLNRVSATVGARTVQSQFGYDGAGVGVAVIDSGVSPWHDDLTINAPSAFTRSKNGQRVTAFVDFVNDRTTPYDDNGHGTHVSGIIAGNGWDSQGARAGMAPGAHLLSLKVLDADGKGVISDVIAALQWTVANKATHNIRVVNLSVGAAITESYKTDPLAIAAKRAVDAGIVVVAAAGNLGKNAAGLPQYGGITSPGNAPWVLTVGASSVEGTADRADDVMAPYSSSGPTAIDFMAKPDLVAPGTGVVSLSDPTSTLYRTKADYLLNGTISTSYKPYLALSGTSMAAPVVAGTVALMIQANPNLTPNLVKGILQYTAQDYHYNPLTQGAGFVNSYGAVQLARFFAKAKAGDRYPTSSLWSKQIIWGSYRLKNGVLNPMGSAWQPNVVWGASSRDGDNIVWGTRCGLSCDNVLWGTLASVVYGSSVWWDTSLVWGTVRSGENIVWGTVRDGDNIVWGTVRDGDNIVWGTSRDGDNIVWGTSAGDVCGTSAEDEKLFDDPDGVVLNFDPAVFDSLFATASEGGL
jgi:serine protease AprX